MAVGSMIPFIGTLVGILPVFILTLASGNDVQAWGGILIYGLIVVGSTDNIIGFTSYRNWMMYTPP